MTTLGLRDLGFVAASSGGLWTPAQITTALWLDAADSSTVITVSGAVSQWNDKSGNNRHAVQSASSERPLYAANLINNLPVITFDGSDDSMVVNTSYMVGLGIISFFYVAVRYGSGSGMDTYRPDVAFIRSGADKDGGAIHYIKNGTNLGASYPVVPSGWGSYDLSSGTAYTNNSPFIISFLSNGLTFAVSRDGTLEGQATATNSISELNQGFLLARQASPSRISNIAIAEFIGSFNIFYADQRRLEGYLAHKWGLTANLPSDHPYKSAPPTV